jgi:hypothetical protein
MVMRVTVMIDNYKTKNNGEKKKPPRRKMQKTKKPDMHAHLAMSVG